MMFVDVQGTLIDDLDRQPLKGAIAFVTSLYNDKKPFVLITNNTKYRSDEFFSYLQGLGFPLEKNNYLDPLMVLGELVPHREVFAVGNEGFLEVLKGQGYHLTKENPKAVIISIKENLSYDDMADCVELVLQGVPLVGMHQTVLYAKKGRRYPGLGAIISAIEYATGVKATIVGKPSPFFYEKGREILGAKTFEEITIISDDPKGDLVGAKELGMKTFFVLSGKYHCADEILPFIPLALHPDRIFDSIDEVCG